MTPLEKAAGSLEKAVATGPMALAPGQFVTTTVDVVPTQVRRPWRSTLRTVAQALLGLVLAWPVIVQVLDLPDWAWVGTSLLVAGAVTRLMANPIVEAWLRRFLPFLAAGSDKV